MALYKATLIMTVITDDSDKTKFLADSVVRAVKRVGQITRSPGGHLAMFDTVESVQDGLDQFRDDCEALAERKGKQIALDAPEAPEAVHVPRDPMAN